MFNIIFSNCFNIKSSIRFNININNKNNTTCITTSSIKTNVIIITMRNISNNINTNSNIRLNNR